MESGKEDDTLRQTVHVLFEATLLRSGFNVPNTNDFAARIERVIRDSLGVDQDLEADVELKPAPEAEKPKSSKQDSEDKESEHDEL